MSKSRSLSLILTASTAFFYLIFVKCTRVEAIILIFRWKLRGIKYCAKIIIQQDDKARI